MGLFARWVLLSVGILLGCSSSNRVDIRGDRDAGGQPITPDPEDGGGPILHEPDGGEGCADEAEWIYLVDSDGSFIRFEPDSLSFHDVGTLSCPGATGYQPFSMSVDRNANAWILFAETSLLGVGSGRIFKVNARDARCEATSFAANQHGFSVFGMGFASDASGSQDETLFVAGGDGPGGGESQLGTVDLGGMRLTPVGETVLPGWPELTGNGIGELWGFFPNIGTADIRRVDKATGATSTTYPLTGLSISQAEAWAFAFWGGRFYMFVKDALDVSTNVWMFDPENASAGVSRVITNSGRRIVGAGVSTCAPVLPI